MSSSPSVGNTYTRSAILAWTNTIFATSHLTFQDIPCHDVALLLYGIFHTHDATAAAAAADERGPSSGTANEASAIIPLLSGEELRHHDAQHSSTCTRFLQLLQFPAGDAPRSRAVSPPPSSSTTATAVIASSASLVEVRNAENVLAMIRALNAEEAALLRAASMRSHTADEAPVEEERPAPFGSAANVILVLGPSMTAAAWRSGSAFVEELKLWRWVRLMADRHRRTVASIRTAIAGYLQHDGAAAVAATHIFAPTRTHASRDGRSPSPEQRDSRDATGDARASNLKRTRLELSPSPIPRSGAAVAAATSPTSSLLQPRPMHGHLSPVHALFSPMHDADRAAPQDSHTTINSSSASVSNAVNAAPLAFREAAEATATAYVTQALPLQQALHTAQEALQQTLHEAHAALSDAPPSSSARSSGGAAETVVAAAVRSNMLPAVVNGGEVQGASCRQRMTARVFASAASAAAAHDTTVEGESSGEGEASSALRGQLWMPPPSCEVCPALMAHAIQCNLNAIDALEEVRAKAIAACLKRDPVALLAALQSVV